MANFGIQFKDKNGNKYYPNPFPIGSIYLSVENVNPSRYFGGTWVQISGGFIYGVQNSISNSSITGTSTGGPSNNKTGNSSKSSTDGHTLTIAEIPSHSHVLWMAWEAGRSWGGNWTYNADKSGGSHVTNATGGDGAHSHGMAHTHSLNSHTHAIPYFGVFVWKRTA